MMHDAPNPTPMILLVPTFPLMVGTPIALSSHNFLTLLMPVELSDANCLDFWS